MIEQLHLLSLLSLGAGVGCALWIARDIRHRPQPMWIMALVWPLCALFGSAIILAGYMTFGRAPAGGQGGHAHHHVSGPRPPFAISVAKGTLHCGSGCTLGDILAETLAFFVPGVAVAFGWPWLFSEKIFAIWGLDFVLAFGLGIAFQYFAIQPMRKLGLRAGLIAALKADAASLAAWQVGMYGFMGFAHFWLFPQVLGQTLAMASAEFWFMMQIAMICGFVTAYPVNWWLIRVGIKERM
ncbi:hypothetical protein CKO11_16295 [Rhodobacter sp. TJ_12]|uniref:DUF4396 domain-containing protein n=1 Tax=Rhodobacter sp. TJ_12 TaxID=2029399 RepID=UPI001CC077D7|nr:DUF4396 domain-containing protein [Rhodobacter sp. TJ_12]MBZ4024013.1 hypothetical protein [Rhodobacter sp. TJ_12]